MKLLEYKVAWIDDQPASADGFYTRLSNHVARHGFQLTVEWISRENELNVFLNSLGSNSDYDLILVDWKLGTMVKAGNSGSTVARDIRFKNPPSYVVFYSSETRATLMRLIADELIDGVYCVNRQHFVPETIDIIRASIRRFEDIETMRGIFLSAVASFDSIVNQALCAGFEGLPEPLKQQVIRGFLEKLEKFHIERCKEIQQLAPDITFPEILARLRVGSSQELSCLIDILSLASPSVNHQTALERLKVYQREFLPGRNDLAHVEENECDGQSTVERGGRVWTPAELGQYRQKIVDNYDNLIYIRDGLIQELLEHLARV